MNRIDCEKCLHSDFDDQDRLRCGLKKCQPEYSDMKETREADEISEFKDRQLELSSKLLRSLECVVDN